VQHPGGCVFTEVEELVAGYKAGETVYQLVHRFGIHREMVAALLERQAVSRRRRSRTNGRAGELSGEAEPR
jgi:hypothetical protein